MRARADAAPAPLFPGGPTLVTALADAKIVLTDTDTFRFPFTVSRSFLKPTQQAGHAKRTPPLPAHAVAASMRVFTGMLDSLDPAGDPMVEVDTAELLRLPVARSTTSALVSPVEAGTDVDHAAARDAIADAALSWVDALGPVISAKRPWMPGVRRPERRTRKALHAALAAAGVADVPATATALAAGIQVPIAAGSWLLAQLARRPDLQDDLRADSALALPLAWETLRLSPPTWLLPRVSVRPTVLGGTPVAAYTVLYVSPLGLGQSEALVPGPDQGAPDLRKFEPRRWVGNTGRPGRWLPFGAGPHACPGRNLGLAQLTAVATWAARYALTATGPLAYDESRGLRPSSPHCRFARRELTD